MCWALVRERQLMDRIRKDFPAGWSIRRRPRPAIAALGAGAAMAGARPFVDFGTGSFSFLAWSQLVNEAAIAHYMSGGTI